MKGGDGVSSGRISAAGDIGTVTVAGITGGGEEFSGYIREAEALPQRDPPGESGWWSWTTAAFQPKTIKKIDIGGALLSGSNITSGGSIGLVTVASSIIGSADAPVQISAETKSGIKKIDVGGNVMFANILAGYNSSGQARNSDGTIGTILIGGNLIASNIVAGIMDVSLNGFGNEDDATITFAGSGKSAIGNIVIGGTVDGTTAPGDHFGITAAVIKKLSISDVPAALTSGKDIIEIASTTGNVTIREI